MIGTRQAEPFYLESPSGEIYTSPFFLAFASVTAKLPPSEKGLIGEKSSSCHLIGARWYDPELGMFLSPDPAGQYANPYSYTDGNAINRVDPNGEKACSYQEWTAQLDLNYTGTVDCEGDPTDQNRKEPGR